MRNTIDIPCTACTSDAFRKSSAELTSGTFLPSYSSLQAQSEEGFARMCARRTLHGLIDAVRHSSLSRAKRLQHIRGDVTQRRLGGCIMY